VTVFGAVVLAEIDHDVTVALITGATTLLVATVPLLIRQHYAQKETRGRIDDLYEKVNGRATKGQEGGEET
jgi:hypothetical protein